MRLTSYTDYSIRVLITLAALNNHEKISIQEIADAFHISKNHLMKVVHRLGTLGVIETIRGRGGGIRLKMAPDEINIGWLVKRTEDDFQIVECFDETRNACIISPVCQAKQMFNEALKAYLNVLEQFTLQDITSNDTELRQTILNIPIK